MSYATFDEVAAGGGGGDDDGYGAFVDVDPAGGGGGGHDNGAYAGFEDVAGGDGDDGYGAYDVAAENGDGGAAAIGGDEGPAAAAELDDAGAASPEQRLREAGVEEADWQAEFEGILRRPHATVEERLAKAVAVRRLAARFADAAGRLARLVVEDSLLAVERRAVPPLTGKGVLGGDKALYKNRTCGGGVFLKYVRDVLGLYGGDTGAAKAAKHEIKSLQALVGCHVDGLYFPLLAVVDYCGYRLVATSLIDGIGDESLRYGSCDAGRTVHASDPRLNEMVRQACEQGLRLAAHNVIDRAGTVRPLYGPADLEGHVVPQPGGAPDSFYLLDFSRLFPPQSPRYGDNALASAVVLDPGSDEQAPARHHTLPPATRRAFLGRQLVAYAAAQRGGGGGAAAEAPSDAEVDELAPALLKGMGVRQVPRSEGVVCYDSRSRLPVNRRASELLGTTVRGRAVVFRAVGRIFYELLRPELVRAADAPLSSDAFSGFGTCARCGEHVRQLGELRDGARDAVGAKCAHACEAHHAAVHDATEDLNGRAVRRLTADLNERRVSPSDGAGLVAAMHAAGVNVRMLGALRAGVQPKHVRRFLLFEMVVRTLRHTFAARLRTAHSRRLSVRGAALALLNLALGSGPAQDAFWRGELRGDLLRKFGEDALSRDERLESHDLRGSLLKFPLLLRLQEATGVRVAPLHLERVFDDPAGRLDVEAPFADEHLASIEPRVKTVDTEREINEHLYALAMRRAEGEAGAEGGGGGAAAVAELYHERAVEVLGESHRDVVAAAWKVAALRARRSDAPEERAAAVRLAERALDRCAATQGRHSAAYVIGLAAVGDLRVRAGEPDAALRHFGSALRLAERIHGHHPVLGKLHAYLGRLHLEAGRRAEGVERLDRAYALYEEFYGRAVADYVAPMIAMGKGEEVAQALGRLAYELKPLVQELADARARLAADSAVGPGGGGGGGGGAEAKTPRAEALFQRLMSAVYVIEDLEGLPRGHFFGGSLDIADRAAEYERAARAAMTSEDALAAGGGGDAVEVHRGAGVEARARAAYAACEAGAIELRLLDGGAADWAAMSGFPEVTLRAPGGEAVSALVTAAPGGDGAAYRAHFVPAAAGEYAVEVRLAGGQGAGAAPAVAFSVLGAPGRASAELSVVRCPEQVERGQQAAVTVLPVDACGNPLTPGCPFGPTVRASARAIAHAPDTVVSRRPAADGGLFDVHFSPNVLQQHEVFVWINGRRAGSRSRHHVVRVVAPAGHGFCNMALMGAMPSKAAVCCGRCRPAKGQLCLRCDRKIMFGQTGKPALFCVGCANRNNAALKCVWCKGSAQGFSFPVTVCAACTRADGAVNKCVGRK